MDTMKRIFATSQTPNEGFDVRLSAIDMQLTVEFDMTQYFVAPTGVTGHVQLYPMTENIGPQVYWAPNWQIDKYRASSTNNALTAEDVITQWVPATMKNGGKASYTIKWRNKVRNKNWIPLLEVINNNVAPYGARALPFQPAAYMDLRKALSNNTAGSSTTSTPNQYKPMVQHAMDAAGVFAENLIRIPAAKYTLRRLVVPADNFIAECYAAVTYNLSIQGKLEVRGAPFRFSF